MKVNSILSKIIIVGLFAIAALVPFIVGSNILNDTGANAQHFYSCGICVVDTYFPYITARNFFFRIVVEIIVALWIILAIRDKTYLPKKSWIVWSFLALLGILSLSTIASENPFKSFWSNNERMEGLFSFFHFFGYFLVAGAVLSRHKLWNVYFNTTIGVSLVLCFFGLGQRLSWITEGRYGWVQPSLQGADRIDAVLGNSIYFAAYLMFSMFLSLYFIIGSVTKAMASKAKTLWQRWWMPAMYGLILIIQGVFLWYTATRGSMLGVFFGFLTIAIFLTVSYPKLRKAGVALLIILVAIIAFMYGVRNTEFGKKNLVITRFEPLLSFDFQKIMDSELKSRISIWSMALRGSMERPVLGWGLESFNYLFYKYYEPRMYDQEAWFDRAHGVVLDWLVAAGIPGAVFYLGLFGTAGYFLIRGRRKGDIRSHGHHNNTIIDAPERIVFVGMGVAYFVHNLFVFDSLTSYMLGLMVLAYIHSIYGDALSEKTTQWIEKQKEILQQVVVPLVIIGFAFILYFGNIKPLQASNALALAQGRVDGGVPGYLAAYQDIIDEGTFITTEARERLLDFSLQVFNAKQVDQQTKSKTIDFAVDQFKKQIEDTPNDIRYMYFLAIILNSTGQHQEALKYLLKAQAISPKKQLILFQIGQSYIALGDFAQALKAYKTAYELDTRYDLAKFYYELAAVYAKDEKLQEALIKPDYGYTELSDQRFINAYIDTKQFGKAIAALKREIVKDPKNPETYVRLSQVYFYSGDRYRAVQIIEDLKRALPERKAEADELIKEIRALK